MEENKGPAARCPWEFGFVNGVLLAAVCWIACAREIKDCEAIGSTSLSTDKSLGWCFSCALMIAASLVFQTVTFLLLRRRIHRKFAWAIIFLVPAAWFAYGCVPRVQAGRILSSGQLGHLPWSARDVRVFTWSTMMSGEE
jgi:hypothetical protein